ncbi:MAG: hypothetical protein OXC07_02465, partial [Kistimonas sp.]|nr:hypothetical protein [Kistimonas sp.]
MAGTGEAIASKLSNPHLCLWIHRPDSQGRLVRTACIAVERPLIANNARSPDGLSLLCAGAQGPAVLQQLGKPAGQLSTRLASPAQVRCALTGRPT